jgi:uncharacterized membrane protein
MTNFIFVLTILAALGSGLIAGVFFAFSTSIMKALGRLPSAEGVAAMQSINVVIINPAFLGVFLGTGLACLILSVVSLLRWQPPGSAYLLAGALLYLIGSLLVTMVLNVPMNNALAAEPPADSLDLWTNYLTNWTFWNHIRTAASLASMAAFIVALVYSAAK